MLEINQENLYILAQLSLDSFKYKSNNVESQQNLLLKDIISSNTNTLFGKEFSFKNINSYEEFTNKVPISEYLDLKPYIDECKTHDNILFKEPICYWAMTSGTSGTHKFIPHTEKSLKNWYRGVFRAISPFILKNPNCNLFDYRFLTIVGPALLDKIGSIPAGYISGIIPQVLEGFKELNISNENINEITDYKEKMNTILKIAINYPNLIAIAGISTFSINFFNYAKNNAYDVLKNEPNFNDLLTYFNEDKTLNLNKVWPSLKFFLSTGVNIDSYRDKLNTMFPGIWISNLYSGTEGAYAFTIDPNDDGMLLNLDLYYFEFKDINTNLVYPLSEVKLKKPYEVIITTYNGLYRYTNGDIIEFTSTVPPKIKVLGRSNLIINLAGEKLSEGEINHALELTCTETNTNVLNYCFFGWIDEDCCVHHCMAIECEENQIDIDKFSNILFKSLKENRVSYRRSADGLFKKPHIIQLKKGSFNEMEKLISNRKGVVGHSKIKHILSLKEISSLLSSDLIEKSNVPSEIINKLTKHIVNV